MHDILDRLSPEHREVVSRSLDENKRVEAENQMLREIQRLVRIENYGPRSVRKFDRTEWVDTVRIAKGAEIASYKAMLVVSDG